MPLISFDNKEYKMTTNKQPPDDAIDLGNVLLDRNVDDAYSILGIQAERLEIAQSREARNMTIPAWTNQDAYDKVISGQRASLADIKRYADQGAQFAKETLKKIEPQIRDILCKDGKIRPEIGGLEGDAKTLLGLVSGSIAGALVA